MDTIEAGSVLIEPGTLTPDSRMLQGKPISDGWISFGKLDRLELEANIRKAGWTFFYLAGETRATVFGGAGQGTVDKAVKRLVASVKAQHFNGLEITRVVMSSFLGVPYATVTGHARHVQEGLVLSRPTAAASSGTRPQRSGTTEEPWFAEEAVAAWEGEGGAPGHVNEVSEPMEVIV